MSEHSTIPSGLNWLPVGPDAHGNPASVYSLSGEYVYERTPTEEGGFKYRRAHWAKIVESASLLDAPLGIWEPVR